MPFKFFAIPIHDVGAADAEMNGFLRSHKALSGDRGWAANNLLRPDRSRCGGPQRAGDIRLHMAFDEARDFG